MFDSTWDYVALVGAVVLGVLGVVGLIFGWAGSADARL